MANDTAGARSAIFGRIATALGRGGRAEGHGDAGRNVAARLREQAPHIKLARVAGSADQHFALLRGFLEGQAATVVEVQRRADVPGAVGIYLRDNNLPARLTHGTDAYLASLPWETVPQLERRVGRAQADDAIGLVKAVAGIAETGTMMMASGEANPVTLNFMPETSVVVIGRSEIVDCYETAWQRIRARFGKGTMPRTVNFVSGPSRSADIGGKLTIGAHGPRRLCVIIVAED